METQDLRRILRREARIDVREVFEVGIWTRVRQETAISCLASSDFSHVLDEKLHRSYTWGDGHLLEVLVSRIQAPKDIWNIFASNVVKQ